MKNDIIDELAKARKEKGLSQGELAQLTGIKRENISRIESGKQNLSIETVEKIASALDKEVNLNLIEEKEDEYLLKLYDEDLMSFRLYKEKLGELKADILWIDEKRKEVFPLDLKASGEGIVKWLQRRIIPKNRYYIEEILNSLGLDSKDTRGIIDVCKGLSLNDSYWVVRKGFKGKFRNYNLYENNFNKVLALIAYTGIYSDARGFTTSPELTTGGMLPKAWRFFSKNDIYLYKGGSTIASNSGREPYMEYYAAQIGKTMGLNIINYDLEKWKGILASKCQLFTDIDTSYYPIGRIVEKGGLRAVIDYYDGLGKTFHDQIRDMLVFDALIMNEDRHFGNFGLLTDSRSGKIISPAPVFDNGLSLLCYISKGKYSLDYMKEYSMKRVSAYGLPFTEIVSEIIENRQRKQLRKVLNFHFERHERYNLPEEFLQNLEIILHERAKQLLEL